MDFIGNIVIFPAVKKWNLVKNWRSYHHEFSDTVLGDMMYRYLKTCECIWTISDHSFVRRHVATLLLVTVINISACHHQNRLSPSGFWTSLSSSVFWLKQSAASTVGALQLISQVGTVWKLEATCTLTRHQLQKQLLLLMIPASTQLWHYHHYW